MILFPDKLQRKYLRQMGCSVLPQFVDVSELDYAHAQEQHPEESKPEAMARAIARVAWKQKGHRKLLVYIIVILVLIFCASKAHAQRGVDGVQVQDSTGTPLHSWFGGIAKLKCSSNTTCTYANGTVTLVSAPPANIVVASAFTGADLGAQINAADASLGATPGEIWVTVAGAITTQVIISSNHTLRLFEGTYTNAFGEYIPPFLLKDNSALICDSWQSIIQNSSNVLNTENNIVSAYNATIGGSGSAGALVPNNSRQTSSNLTVRGCQFTDGGTGNGSSLTGQVALVNCTNCKVLDNFFNGAHGTHVTLVGSSNPGANFGAIDEIAGNHSYGAKDAAVSVINNASVDIHDNFFHGHGNGAAAFIDLEGNLVTDHMQYVDVRANIMDMTDATNSVYGITCNSGGGNQNNIKLHDNIMFGLNTGANKFIQGIACGASGVANSYTDVEIYNNQIYFTVQAAISVGGITRAFLHGNRIHCGGGPAIDIQNNVLDSVIQNNIISAPLSVCNASTSTYRVLALGAIQESAGADRNIYKDNVASRVLISGASSKVFSSSTVEGSGKTERVPVGLSTYAGGVKTAQLSPPTLSVTTGATGVCVLAGGNYIWRVTAVDASGGESTASNQVTQNAGGGFGCAQLSWTFVPGAISYNIYRALSAGPPELLIDAVTNYGLSYGDLGGQVPGATFPATNSTGGLLVNSEVAPTCAAAFRGLITYTASAAGVKDIVQVCAKDAADSYAYRAIY